LCCQAAGSHQSILKSPASLCFIELDPKYVSVIVQCWRDQTGQGAKLEASGKSFSEMASKKRAAA
jgi:hypothetical protein